MRSAVRVDLVVGAADSYPAVLKCGWRTDRQIEHNLGRNRTTPTLLSRWARLKEPDWCSLDRHCVGLGHVLSFASGLRIFSITAGACPKSSSLCAGSRRALARLQDAVPLIVILPGLSGTRGFGPLRLLPEECVCVHQRHSYNEFFRCCLVRYLAASLIGGGDFVDRRFSCL